MLHIILYVVGFNSVSALEWNIACHEGVKKRALR